MRLLKFRGQGLHDFLDVGFSFNKDLTFLVGINGSGKTTALNAINALISPSPDFLGKMDFKKIKISFENNGKRGFVEARKDDGQVSLHATGIKEPLKFQIYIPDSDQPPYRDAEHERDYYRDILVSHGEHQVIQFIKGLPTPMFLGLSRRAALPDPQNTVLGWRSRSSAVRKNIFSGSLAQGVTEATKLAEVQNREVQFDVSRLGDKLRKDMLLELLTVEQRKGLGNLNVPSEEELKKVPEMRKGLDSLAKILDIPAKMIEQKFSSFLGMLEKTGKRIPVGTSLEDLFEAEELAATKEARDDVIEALVHWNVNSPELKRIARLSDLVEIYNQEVKSKRAEIDKYLDLINQFLADSGKEISFDERGDISIFLVNGGYRIPISSLSSGESQIFVILTHLFFNRRAKSNNVFIIDEPELSLHVQWQELFVESMLTANPNIQYVMATHSPSIILEKTEYCVDVESKISKQAQVKSDDS